MLKGSVKSKTMWSAVITAMFGAAILNMPLLQNALTPELYGYIMIVLGVVHAGLRVITTQPLDQK